MSSFEFNKVFAAVLVAGITAMLAGFIAEQLTSTHDLEKDAVTIEGVASVGGGPVKVAMPDPVLHLIATADVARGQKLSKACAACHSFDSGGSHKVGPNLWGVVGSPMGAKSGFKYSDGMSSFGGNWDYADLNKFLWKPKKYVVGTKMSYIGMKKPNDRAAMIAWLRTLSGSAEALPSAGDIAKEAAELAPAVEEPAVDAVTAH